MRIGRKGTSALAVVATLAGLAQLQCRGEDPALDGLDAGGATDASPSPPNPSDPVLPLGAVEQIVAGEAFTCVRGSGGAVRCWGSNSHGQLGQDSPAPFRADVAEDSTIRFGTDEKVVDLAAAYETVCAVFERGSVRCWGANSTAERGSGDQVSKGRAPGDMASLAPVDLGPNRSALRVFGGTRHFCVITRNIGDVLCWGHGADGGRYGFLGNGRPDNIGDHEGEMGTALERVPLPEPTSDLALAFVSTCALGANTGAVRCFGVARGGQLGNGSPLKADASFDVHDVANAPLTVDAGARALFGNGPAYAVKMDDGRVLTWGENEHGRLGLGDGDDRPTPVPLLAPGPIESVVSRSAHRCVILANGDLYCFGGGEFGRLGYGDAAGRGHSEGTRLEALSEPVLKNVRSVAVGGDHTCALRNDGAVVCWGRNHLGQLGYGDTTDRGSQGADKASVLPAVHLD